MGPELDQLGRDHHFRVEPQRSDAGVDLVLVNDHGRRVGVEVRGSLRTRQFAETVRRLRATDFAQKLLVVGGRLPDEFARAFRADNIWILGWRPDRRTSFSAALEDMDFIESPATHEDSSVSVRP